MSIILLVGASGSGKTTIGKRLERYGIAQLTSFTTRPMREGEVDGVDYHFVDKKHLDTADLAEISYYNSNTYGLTKDEIDSKLDKYQDVYFVADRNGASQLVDMYPDEVIYFWLNITIDTMIERMENRGDGSQQILDRIRHAVINKELVKPSGVGCEIITLDSTLETIQLADFIASQTTNRSEAVK